MAALALSSGSLLGQLSCSDVRSLYRGSECCGADDVTKPVRPECARTEKERYCLQMGDQLWGGRLGHIYNTEIVGSATAPGLPEGWDAEEWGDVYGYYCLLRGELQAGPPFAVTMPLGDGEYSGRLFARGGYGPDTGSGDVGSGDIYAMRQYKAVVAVISTRGTNQW